MAPGLGRAVHVARWRDALDYLDPVHEAVVARLMILSRHLAGSREASRTLTPALPRPSFKVLLALRRLGAPYTASPSAGSADHRGLSRGALLGPPRPAGGRRGWRSARSTATTGAGCTSGSPPPGAAPSTGTRSSQGRDEAALLSALSPADRQEGSPAGRPAPLAGARASRAQPGLAPVGGADADLVAVRVGEHPEGRGRLVRDEARRPRRARPGAVPRPPRAAPRCRGGTAAGPRRWRRGPSGTTACCCGPRSRRSRAMKPCAS